jgi:arylmalonate decarboxylase
LDQRVGKRTKAAARPAEESALVRMLSYYDPYGWIAKLGLIVPASNTVMAHEWGMLAPAGISVHTARVSQSGRSSQASFDEMAAGAELAAAQLRTAGVDAIAYGCTSGSFMTAPAEVTARIAEIGGCHATNAADSAIAALEALGVRRVSLATPYMDYIQEREIAYLEAAGFEVVASLNLGLGETEAERFAIRNVPPKAVFRMACAVDRVEADAIFISCTSLASLGVIGDIEAHVGKPVVTSNQATFWNALRLLKLRFDIPAGGRLTSGGRA